MNAVIEQILKHSSVRKFTDKPIEKALLEQLIVCGQAASTSSFIQAYTVIRVTDPSHRKKIAEAAGGQTWIENAAEFLVFCADLKRVEYCCEKTEAGRLEGYTEHFIAATVDTALMAQNLLLAAESVGLGGVFIGGIRNAPEEVSECLELPDQVYPVFGMCLGWPAHHPQVKPRMPVMAILHNDRYPEADTEQTVDTYDETITTYYRERLENRRISDWSAQTAKAIQGKKREHMLEFLKKKGFLKR